MFESVKGRTHGRTYERRLESHHISSLRAFGSGELTKTYINRHSDARPEDEGYCLNIVLLNFAKLSVEFQLIEI